MWNLLRRSFWLALLGGAGYAAYSTWQRNQEPEAADPPTWPPLDTDPRPAPASPVPEGMAPAAPSPTVPSPTVPSQTAAEAPTAAFADVPDTSAQRWADPVDGECPEGYPIKGNANSGIYHVPGGRFYERTIPERCYATEADAEADGYRRAKA